MMRSLSERIDRMELSSDVRYQILRALEDNPDASQRDLARLLGMSLGRVNFCLRALIEKGVIKARRFKNSRNKLAYMYSLTPAGIREKSRVTLQFLREKIAEVERLQQQIEEIRAESRRSGRS